MNLGASNLPPIKPPTNTKALQVKLCKKMHSSRDDGIKLNHLLPYFGISVREKNIMLYYLADVNL